MSASISTLAALARAFNADVDTISDAAINAIDTALLNYNLESLTFRQFSEQLVASVRASYSSAGGLAESYSRAVFAEYRLDLEPKVSRNSAYLKALTKDVIANAKVFFDSPRDLDDTRRLRFRVSIGAQVAAQRGFTDSQIASFAVAEKKGYQIRKVWLANFDNNQPCAHCVALHGTNISYKEIFSTDAKIYHDLAGPPCHPWCHCTCVFYIVSTSTPEGIAAEQPEPEEPKSLSASAIRAMSDEVYQSVTTVLKAIVARFRRGRRAK